MTFQSFSKIGESFENGKYFYSYVTKTTTPIPGTAGFFVDLNQTSGIPKYNAFAGSQLAFNQLSGLGNGGVYAGPIISGSQKYLQKWQCLNVNVAGNTIPPDHVILSDYLGFYPLIDCDDLSEQVLDNTQTISRYVDGEGVRVVLIVQAPMIATASVTIKYTNSIGVSGRTSTHNIVAGSSIGVCATASGTIGGADQVTPFFPLAENDTGVRLIESIQFAASAGGFICAALVRPLASMMIYESAVPVEKFYGFDNQNIPEIKDGAYLNFLIKRVGTLAGSLRSELVFVNS